MGAQSTFVRFTFGFISGPTQLEYPSILRGGSILSVQLTERKLYRVMRQVRAKASVSLEDCQQLLSSLPAGVGGLYNLRLLCGVLMCGYAEIKINDDPKVTINLLVRVRNKSSVPLLP